MSSFLLNNMSVVYFLIISVIFLQLNVISSTNRKLVNFKNNACYSYFDYMIYPISRKCFESPWVLLDAVQLILKNGYHYEEHVVKTDDGNILRMFRVFNENSRLGQPVFMFHGIETDCSTFLQREKDSLAFNLVELGYDVWLGNSRTTKYGKEHVTLNAKDKAFWNFTCEELAKYDVRNSLQKVATITGKGGEILYIGHSLGNPLAFMYGSEFPSDKLIKCHFALSPVAFASEKFTDKLSMTASHLIVKLLKAFGINYLYYDDLNTHRIYQIICKAFPYYCLISINLSLGQSDLFLPEELTIYYSNYPDTIATNQLLQVSDLKPNSLRKFDYGSRENQKRYGQKTPPEYDLKKITIPTFLFLGNNDQVVKVKPAERLLNALGSKIKELHVVPINNTNKSEQFGHIQFLIGPNITQLFYQDLYKFMARCSTK